MTKRQAMMAGIGLALLATTVAIRSGLLERSVSMDNRLYFYIAERAASGVPPHVSTPDVKSQLSTLVDAASISLGRKVGLDDVHAGRIGALVILIVGIWGVGLSVYGLGASAGAAAIAAFSVLAFSNLVGHAAVGFNPKILLFTFLAWGPWLVARRQFAWAGVAATGAMLCWQPAAAACLATALAALTDTRRLRAVAATIAGGVAAFAVYELYFVWHGVLDVQLFQTWLLPLGSVHEATEWMRGIRFVIFGSCQGIDRLGIPGIAFVLFTCGSIARLLGLRVPSSRPASAPAAVLVATAGVIVCWFTAYEHQAEPDRFLLVAYYAIALGVVVDWILQWARTHAAEHSAYRLEGALVVLLFVFLPRRAHDAGGPTDGLKGQLEAAQIVAMNEEAYGSLWTYGCIHLLGLAHLTNYHPVEHFWDDLGRYVDESTFEPVVHGRLPNVIVRRRGLPGRRDLLDEYTAVALPGLAERARLYVRSSFIGLAPTRDGQETPVADAHQRGRRAQHHRSHRDHPRHGQ